IPRVTRPRGPTWCTTRADRPTAHPAAHRTRTAALRPSPRTWRILMRQFHYRPIFTSLARSTAQTRTALGLRAPRGSTTARAGSIRRGSRAKAGKDSPDRTVSLSSARSLLPWARPGASEAKRSEEHTSELQSRLHLVCRLLLEKKNTTQLRTSNCTTHVEPLQLVDR